MSESQLAVRLTVEPACVSAQSELAIHGEVHNLGSQIVNTQLYASVLLVDGEAAANWPLTIGNGIQDARELALPPGEQIEFARNLAASSLLGCPGVYEITLVVRGVPSPVVQVEWREFRKE